MNRRELLRRGFELGAAGLLLPMVEPIRRYWSLDRTMVPQKRDLAFYKNHPAEYFQDFGPQIAPYKIDTFPEKFLVGDYTVAVDVTDEFPFRLYGIASIEGESMWVTGIDGRTLSVLRY